MPAKNIRRFIVTAQITLIFVYLVIIAGSVVRATGSGMGCPDWPKCFGKFIPPTSVTELPTNYKEIYAGDHHAVGEFNAWKTWTEYLNRLVGMLLGILSLLQLIMSFFLRKQNKRIFTFSLLEFILIGFQGWLGSKVVSSNLEPAKITTHMVVALIILSVVLFIIHLAKQTQDNARTEANPMINRGLKKWGLAVFIATIAQIMMGTQVREEVDVLLKNFDAIYRNEIVEHLSEVFLTHRSFSILIVLLNGIFIYKIYKSQLTGFVTRISKWLGIFLIISIVTGVILSRLGLPAPAQPTHLLLACIIYGLQWMLILKLWQKQQV